jgi:beta-phosphoglucomutase
VCIPSNLKAVVFDLDGVILDSMPAHAASWQEVFAEVGIRVESQFIYLHEGNLDWPSIRDTLAPGFEDPGPDFFQTLLSRQREVFNHQYAAKVTVFTEAEPLLKDIKKAGLDLALVTSSSRQVLSPDLAEWLNGYFRIMVTGDAVTRHKPHPEPYLTAIKALQIDPEQALAVENAPVGVQSAKAAGLTCFALTTTLTPDDLKAADRVFPDHAALSGCLFPTIGP